MQPIASNGMHEIVNKLGLERLTRIPVCVAVKRWKTIRTQIQFWILLLEATRLRLTDCCSQRLLSSPHRLHRREKAWRDNWQKPSSLCHSFPALLFLPLHIILSSPLTQSFVHCPQVEKSDKIFVLLFLSKHILYTVKTCVALWNTSIIQAQWCRSRLLFFSQ